MNVEELRAFATGLPHVTEDIKWESDLCFCIAGKMFCVTNLNAETFQVSLKVEPSEFDLLIEKDGIDPAPYLARYKWIYIKEESILSQTEWHNLVAKSYELVKRKLPKKVLNDLK